MIAHHVDAVLQRQRLAAGHLAGRQAHPEAGRGGDRHGGEHGGVRPLGVVIGGCLTGHDDLLGRVGTAKVGAGPTRCSTARTLDRGTSTRRRHSAPRRRQDGCRARPDPPYRGEMLDRVRALAARLRREDWVDLGLAGLIAVVVTVDGFSHTLGTAGHGATTRLGAGGDRAAGGAPAVPAGGVADDPGPRHRPGRRHRVQRGSWRLLRPAGRRLHGRRPHAPPDRGRVLVPAGAGGGVHQLALDREPVRRHRRSS